MMGDLALLNREIEVFLVKTGSNLDDDACTDFVGKKDDIGKDDDFYDSDYSLSEDEVGIDWDFEDGVFEGAVERKSQPGLDLMYEEEEINVGDESDVYDSDELRSLDSEDDEDNTVKKKKKVEFTRFNPATYLPDPKFVTGLLFTNAAEFKNAVRSHAITWQRDIKFVKNDDKRVKAKCRGKNCAWVLHASRNGDKSCTFQVKTSNTVHKCGRSLSKHRFVTSQMLSQKYLNDWRLNNGWKVDDFQEKVQNDLNMEVSRSQFYRTKNKVNDLLYGKYKDQYKRIYDYCEELKGLLPALHEILPMVEHRYCVRHMHNNFKKYHPGLGLKDKLWNLAKATSVAQFSWQMDLLKKVDEGAHQWLSEVPAKHWSKSHFSVYSKCDILLNNLCESFNATILEARNKPLLNMLEKIRIYIQKRLQAKRVEATNWDGPLCPKIQKILDKLKNDTRSCISTYVGGSKFEVRDGYGGQNAVNVNQRTCSCRRWDLNVRGASEWKNTSKGPVAPNFVLKLPGRPRKNRIKEAGKKTISKGNLEKLRKVGQASVTCGICHEVGHNKKHCPLKRSEIGEASVEPPTDDVQPPTANANQKPKKKRRCNVCLQDGHNRAKCPTPVTQPPTVAASPTASSDHLRPAASSHEHQSRRTFSIFTLENPSAAAPPSPPPPTSQASSVCIGGVSMKASFKKKGKACVTLKSLTDASRLKKGNGEGESNMGMSTQQSSVGMNEG
ncbi:hypothetical protein BUALT_Bualt06G0014900 [Buddleja alternifolia]|uniref:CCHC-type domain-containing protein n=1 Tax=Buddleja alternifolia TaxID=168488 RepID=A0AAV6XJS6_9LAMI|nr:hypothetical protein BUALT_Bualt06G0014900 [Buddleja alternifolia]